MIRKDKLWAFSFIEGKAKRCSVSYIHALEVWFMYVYPYMPKIFDMLYMVYGYYMLLFIYKWDAHPSALA